MPKSKVMSGIGMFFKFMLTYTCGFALLVASSWFDAYVHTMGGTEIRLWDLGATWNGIVTGGSVGIFVIIAIVISWLYSSAGAKMTFRKFCAASAIGFIMISLWVLIFSTLYGLRLNHPASMMVFLAVTASTSMACVVASYLLMVTEVQQTLSVQVRIKHPVFKSAMTVLTITGLYGLVILVDYFVSDLSKPVLFLFPDLSISFTQIDFDNPEMVKNLIYAAAALICLISLFGIVFYMAFVMRFGVHLKKFLQVVSFIMVTAFLMISSELVVFGYVQEILGLPYPKSNLLVFLVFYVQCFWLGLSSANSVLEVEFETVDETATFVDPQPSDTDMDESGAEEPDDDDIVEAPQLQLTGGHPEVAEAEIAEAEIADDDSQREQPEPAPQQASPRRRRRWGSYG